MSRLGTGRREVAKAILGGLVSQAAAARELGISTEAIRRWVARERERRSPFVAVEVSEDGGEGLAREAEVVEVLVAGGRRLRVSAGIGATDLVRLVRALESC